MENQRKRNAKDNVPRDGRVLDYLGYCFVPGNVRMRKSIKQTFARKSKRINNKKRRREVLASYWGWCKWGNCRHLWNVITDKDMSFADHGINGRVETKDGKKFFDVEKVSLEEIVKDPITVLEYEEGVKTQYGPGRIVVKIIHNGAEKKIITNSFTIKSMLKQAKEMNLFPIETRVLKKPIEKGRWDFYFE
jgi:hypothetical protein